MDSYRHYGSCRRLLILRPEVAAQRSENDRASVLMRNVVLRSPQFASAGWVSQL